MGAPALCVTRLCTMRGVLLFAALAGAVSSAMAGGGHEHGHGSDSVVVETTSGALQGTVNDDVVSFKGVRYGQPPVRWAAPVAFKSKSTQDATKFGATCVQQISSPLSVQLYNNPSDPPVEGEDCLFLNVWAPAKNAKRLPVVIWIYGGSLALGSTAIPMYDGFSFAKNQDVILVSVNYRTNIFGFPGSSDLPLAGNNLGFMDQELAIAWVHDNIAQFGGDPKKVTIMGESAGALSVSAAIIRRNPGPAPFRAAIMLSGARTTIPMLGFGSFDKFASAFNCTQSPGDDRLACLRQISSADIRNWTFTTAVSFRPVVDNVTVMSDPMTRIRTKQTANIPFIIGNMQDDGTLFTINQTNLTSWLITTFAGAVTENQVRPLYPGLNDTQIIWAAFRDSSMLCSAHLWATAAVGAGIRDVYRYSYGAVWQDLQKFPNAGAWHSSELFSVFGTYNRTTATPAEATLSRTIQTTIANFVKDPTNSPAPNWPRYLPGNNTKTLAKLAYNGNVAPNNVIDAVRSDALDGPCALWDKFLDIRM